MAEKKKKKKQPKGMPSGSIQSRMPSSTNTGKSPKKAVKKKRSLMERINPFDKESKERRAAKKRMKASKRMSSSKYKKGSKPAKSFRAAFKSNCSGGAKSFTWDGRSYSCKKK